MDKNESREEVKNCVAVQWAKWLNEVGVEYLRNQFRDHVDWYETKLPSTAFQANQEKCRYYNVPLHDANRIILKERRPDEDFYHASRVTDENYPSLQFIAAQGPLRNTVEDFWTMVFQEKCSLIVQLCSYNDEDTPSSIQCAQYWSEEQGGCLVAGDFRVTTHSVAPIDSKHTTVQLRTLKIHKQSSNELHELFHIYISDWPDYGVPQTVESVAAAVKWVERNLLKEDDVNRGPILVHCLAGVGRTMTFIGSVLGNVHVRRTPSLVPSTMFIQMAQSLRRQRPWSIQTSDQYIFSHALVLSLLVEDEIVPSDTVKAFPFLCHKG